MQAHATIPTTTPSIRRAPLAAIGALLAAGLGLGIYLTYAKLGVTYLDGFESGCNFGGKLDCDAVQMHPASVLLGIPISVWSVPTYLVMGWLAWRASRSDAHAPRAASYLVLAALWTAGFSTYLLVLSFTGMDVLCPFCLAMHSVNFVILGLAFAARRADLGTVLADAKGLAHFAPPTRGALVVAGVTCAAAFAGFLLAEGALVDAQKAAIAVQFSDAADSAGDAVAPGPATDPGAAVSAGDGDGAAAAVKTTPPTPRPKRTPKLTEAGYDYFDIPVGPEDHIFGNAEAAVTVTMIKDFECGFCRFLTGQMKPLMDKYKDRARFVFKHYPMNADCNPRMGNSRMHEGACRAAFASHCAEEQGKFWEYEEILYANQKKFSDAELAGYATEIGMDAAAFATCYASDRPAARVARDVKLAARMRINGTPRIYVDGRLVTGSTARDVLDYYITMALEQPEPAAAAADAPQDPATAPAMVSVQGAGGPFWIDAFEASVDAGGKAVSAAGAAPALVSWFDAKAACEASGKRLCTEQEWVSACIGEVAEDTNKNGIFTDGPVTGRLYPYGPFYDKGTCRDAEDKYTGAAGKTGAHAGCRTPEGVWDMTGNLYEWVGAEPAKAAQIGGDWRSAASATCRRRTTTYGPGLKNKTTGFRCCADAEVAAAGGAPSADQAVISDVVGGAVPSDLALDAVGGGTLSPKTFAGKVTYLTFFASWCGNCRKQMPAIKAWQEEWADKGFQVVAINIDRVKAKGEKYVSELEPNFLVALDPEARTMSDFDVNAMPTSFIIDRDGTVKKRVIGYRAPEIPATRAAITELLSQGG